MRQMTLVDDPDNQGIFFRRPDGPVGFFVYPHFLSQKKAEQIIRYETHTDCAVKQQSRRAVVLPASFEQDNEGQAGNAKSEKTGNIQNGHGFFLFCLFW